MSTTKLLENNIDLNSLFSLTYNFELLKQVIEALLLGNKDLNKKVKDLEDKSNNNNDFLNLEKKINNIKNEYDEKLNSIYSRLQKSEENISNINIKLNKINFDDDDFNDLKNKVKKNTLNIHTHNEQIEDIYSRIKELDSKIKEIETKISNINISPIIENNNNSLSDMEKFLQMLESIKTTFNSKFNSIGEKVNKNKLDIDSVKIDIDELNKNSHYFKENINILFDKIEELKKLINRTSNDDIENKIKKYINDELADILKKIDLKISNLKLNNLNKDNISDEDLKLINELLKRVIELENLYRKLSNQPKVDELEKEIKKIYELLNIKLEEKDLLNINTKLNKLEDSCINLDERLNKLENLFNKDIPIMKNNIDNLNDLINFLKQTKVNDNSNKNNNKTIGDYVDLFTFHDFKNQISKDLNDLNNKIDNILKDIEFLKTTKVNYDDLENLKLLLFKKIEELKNASNKKFADKNETNNNFKILDDKIKIIIEEIKKINANNSNNLKTSDNWLLAKKPMGNNWCASCDSYIGELKESKEYSNWNKWPGSYNDKNQSSSNVNQQLKKGNGYSKLLQLNNFGDVYSANSINNDNNDVIQDQFNYNIRILNKKNKNNKEEVKMLNSYDNQGSIVRNIQTANVNAKRKNLENIKSSKVHKSKDKISENNNDYKIYTSENNLDNKLPRVYEYSMQIIS